MFGPKNCSLSSFAVHLKGKNRKVSDTSWTFPQNYEYDISKQWANNVDVNEMSIFKLGLHELQGIAHHNEMQAQGANFLLS